MSARRPSQHAQLQALWRARQAAILARRIRARQIHAARVARYTGATGGGRRHRKRAKSYTHKVRYGQLDYSTPQGHATRFRIPGMKGGGGLGYFRTRVFRGVNPGDK